MLTVGPLEISVPRYAQRRWSATWHPKPTRPGRVWLYRWAICTPWLHVMWVSHEALLMLSGRTKGRAG